MANWVRTNNNGAITGAGKVASYRPNVGLVAARFDAPEFARLEQYPIRFAEIGEYTTAYKAINDQFAAEFEADLKTDGADWLKVLAGQKYIAGVEWRVGSL